jgi:NAD-dependent SIR2 family protein deacetylase
MNSDDASIHTFWNQLKSGAYRNIIVLTGAGISTNAGIKDFRSGGGLFEVIREKFPGVEPPEVVLSRRFQRSNPEFFSQVVSPWLASCMTKASPTLAHRFCALLHEKGWLTRVYTQNVDGLHSIDLPSSKVVECHGSLVNPVLYGDSLPSLVDEAARTDFPTADLLLVLGTSLKVGPFCALPNLCPRNATRVWVTLKPDPESQFEGWTKIGGRLVTLKSLWIPHKRSKYNKYANIIVDQDCDVFVQPFFETETKASVKSQRSDHS